MQQINRLRLVTFDVTGTLLNFRVPPAEKYAEVGAQFGVTVDAKAITASLKKQWRYMSFTHPNFGQSTGLGWEKWWKHLVKQTFQDTVTYNTLDVSILDAVAEHLLELYKTSECWKTVKGAKGLLACLNTLNIPVGVISNNDERLETVLKTMKLHQYFQFVITSYCAGFEKPDSRIFQLALCKLGNRSIKPNEALHVGNVPETDYIGALKAGWNAALVHQNAKNVVEHYKYIDPELVFETLEDLQSFITMLHK
jgi:REG-2-like HAD superfamily hydrolase